MNVSVIIKKGLVPDYTNKKRSQRPWWKRSSNRCQNRYFNDEAIAAYNILKGIGINPGEQMTKGLNI